MLRTIRKAGQDPLKKKNLLQGVRELMRQKKNYQIKIWGKIGTQKKRS